MTRWQITLLMGLTLGLAATAAQATITVDGTASAGEWALTADLVDPNEGAIDNRWDISDVWVMVGGTNIYFRWDTYNTPVLKNDDLQWINYIIKLDTGGGTVLQAKSVPTNVAGVKGTAYPADDYFLENNGSTAGHRGKYAVGSVVEASLPLAAFTDLGMVLPDTFTIWGEINNWMYEADDITDGTFNGEVPEPATLALVAFGLAGLAARCRRSR
ncbi:MAG: PEP-CTERM sorting domain-containing protein [Planctomycetes bacterium]|nr:PEP-CTERM sorting domain-containing protein [Planctomycetota bacterium]